MKNEKRFTAEQRLRGQAAFKNLVEKGTFARGRFFYVWAGEKSAVGIEPSARPALGVVVSKKTQARATRRNLIKRRVRESFRATQGALRPGIAILVKAREGRAIPDQEQTNRDLGELFRRTGILV
ncbi:MAG TPA: ribonuclease P protein component [Candidatus Omnitrophota bacterium]|nr:ribonuclease P protein component [Candidatus Omnitrophota bacterium]